MRNTNHDKQAIRRAQMLQKQELVTKCLDNLRKPDVEKRKAAIFLVH